MYIISFASIMTEGHLGTCSKLTVITPLLSLSSFLKPSVRERSITQHWMKSSNFMDRWSLLSNTRVHSLQKSTELKRGGGERRGEGRGREGEERGEGR